MKHLLTLLFVAVVTGLSAQCLNKCTNDSASATARNELTGQPFDLNDYTISWTSTLPGFTGQNTARIRWSDIGNTPGTYNVSYTVTEIATGCDTTITGCFEIGGATASLNPPTICSGDISGIPVSGGSPTGGTYEIGGSTVTTLLPSHAGQQLTYRVSSGGCQGIASAIINVRFLNGEIILD